MSDHQKLTSTSVGSMNGIGGPKRGEIINRQLCHFFRADMGLGMAIAKGLGVDLEDTMPKEHSKAQATTVA